MEEAGSVCCRVDRCEWEVPAGTPGTQSKKGAMMRLQVVRAIYKDGTLVFAHPEVVPRNGAEVVVTYVDDSGGEGRSRVDPLQALRGRGKGERLVERLVQSRREDRARDESGHKPLCT